MARNNNKPAGGRRKPNGTRREEEAIAQRRLRVFLAWSQGEAQHAIATREQVHPGQITRDLDAILGELHERDLDKADENRRRLLGEIAWQKQELRAAWERSKKPKDRKKARRSEGLGRNGNGERRDAEMVTEGRDGNPKFMAEIKALEELEARLLGIAANKHEHTGPNGGPIQHTVLTDEPAALPASMPPWAAAIESNILLGKPASPVERYLADPSEILSDAGFAPDQWQRDLLRANADRIILNITRQGGKSLTASALAICQAVTIPDSLILLLSRALRQAGELFKDKMLRIYRKLGDPVRVVQETALTMTLANGSRIVSLPGDGDTIVGYSGVAMLVIDEASRVPDDLYRMVRPMLAVSQGKLVCLSTPYGKRGFFYEEWQSNNRWLRVRVTADECPRISRGFLEEERSALGERWYRQEYLCSFEETVDSVFATADIEAARSTGIEPWEI